VRFLIPKSRLGLIVRVFCAALLVTGSCAGAVATAGLLQFQQVVQDINVVPGSIVKTRQITLPQPGAPQTLLVIGSDHRANSPSFQNANTDTMLLVRLNAASSTINLMSIPRDLQVTVPGYGVEKINAAYSQGGYGLLIKTIKQNVFPQLRVNHIIDTNFDGFSAIVNAIGCVWADVDHRYFNVSQPYGPDNYSSINIQPGYQRLCGSSQVTGALAFVRFRHTDSDLVREARQQDFLRWAKQNFPLSKLLADKDKLLRIFARHTTLDANLKTENGIIELFDLVLNANGDSLKQIPFPATLSNPGSATAPDYVYKQSDRAVAAAWANFMHPTAKGASPSHASSSSSHRSGGAGRHPKGPHHRAPGIDTAGLTLDPADGIAQAKQLTPDMPVYYPRYILSGSQYCTATGYECLNGDEPAAAYAHSYPRQYRVTTTSGTHVHAYFMTLAINPALGEYYGIQGVHWSDPPILKSPSAFKVFHGRRFEIYADDHGHVTDVAWHADGNSYWVSNTLTSTIGIKQMIAIAESTVPYGG
jgi:LCP family protein required for cell wall assembly